MKIDSGASTNKSIAFRSESMRVRARYDKNGNIKITKYFIQSKNKKENGPFTTVKILAIITAILNIGIYKLDLPKIINIIPIILAIGFQTFIITVQRRNSEILKNHVVEHQIIAAVDKYSKNATIEDIKNAPKFSKECGSSIVAIYIAYKIVALIISIKFNIIVPEIIVYSLYKTTFLFYPIYYIGYLTQALSFKKPDEENYILGKAALDAFIEFYEKVKAIDFEDEYKILEKNANPKKTSDSIKDFRLEYEKKLTEMLDFEIKNK